MIWRQYLKRYFWQEETLWLQGQRFLAMAEFNHRYLYSILLECIKFETRLLQLETGDLRIQRMPTPGRWFHVPTRTGLDIMCMHPTLWARVRSPSLAPRLRNLGLLRVRKVPEKKQRTGDKDT